MNYIPIMPLVSPSHVCRVAGMLTGLGLRPRNCGDCLTLPSHPGDTDSTRFHPVWGPQITFLGFWHFLVGKMEFNVFSKTYP